MSDDYQVENIHRYIRKSYNKNKKEAEESFHGEDTNPEMVDTFRNDGYGLDPPRVGCSCGTDPDGEIANILHKKCAVITLAEQQLQKLLNETDKLLSDNSTRSVYNCMLKFKELLRQHNIKCQCVLITMVGFAFIFGLLVGAATCSSFPGRFDSPVLTCVESLFIRYTNTKIDNTYRSIT